MFTLLKAKIGTVSFSLVSLLRLIKMINVVSRTIISLIALLIWCIPTLRCEVIVPDIAPVQSLSGKHKAKVLEHIFKAARDNENRIDEYGADCYLKGEFIIHKHNLLLRYIPSIYSFRKGGNRYIYESFSRIHYTAPNIYDRKIVALTSTFSNSSSQLFDILDYLKLNLYSSSILEDKILSPFSSYYRVHYRYDVDSLYASSEHPAVYRIRVRPKHKGPQLVSGEFLIDSETFLVQRMRLMGKYNMIGFDLVADMGTSERTRLLPVNFRLNLHFNFLFNKLEMQYRGTLKYDKIRFSSQSAMEPKAVQYNLTPSYSLSSDTTKILDRADFFNRYRPIPLTEVQEQIYADARNDEQMQVINPDSLLALQEKHKSRVFWGQVGDVLLNSYAVDMNKVGSFNFSGIFNPVLFSYSPSRGLNYQQVVKYNRLFNNGNLLRIVPNVGYNFTRKELYGSLELELYYNPHRQGRFYFNIGNENRIYSDLVMRQMRAVGDTLDFARKDWYDYFEDIQIECGNQIELLNGLNLFAGLAFHRRKLYHSISRDYPLRTEFNSFAPRVRISWTPGMYYYMNGMRKINTWSRYPTFILDYERGIKVFRNFGEYERVELSMEHSQRFRNLNVLAYHLGAGTFTRLKDSYFVSYADFSNRYLTTGWTDDIGGSFQMLDGHWYNAARHYVRMNLSFESPFLILYPINRVLPFIERERLYAGGLLMPGLQPYLEFGYGFGTYIFDIGGFVGLENGRFSGIGCKFTFQLFNK